jgi:hypothetical protein
MYTPQEHECSIFNSDFVASFETNKNIDDRVLEISNAFGSFFQVPFMETQKITNINIDINSNPSIVRHVGISKHNHSNIKISQNSLVFSTKYNYTDTFTKNHIKAYLHDRLSTLVPIIEKEKLAHYGVILNIFCEMDEASILGYIKEQSGVKFVRENTSKVKLYYSLLVNNDFFVNITLSKDLKQEHSGSGILIDGKLNDPINVTTITKHGIGLIIDFNNKPIIRTGKQLSFENFYETLFAIIEKNSLQNYLSGEVLS